MQRTVKLCSVLRGKVKKDDKMGIFYMQE